MAATGAIRAGAAYVELYAKDNRLTKGLKSIQGKLKSFGSSVESLGTKIFAGGASVIAPLLGAAQQFASMGDVFSKLSDRTGASVESLSELAYAAEQSGASVESLGKGMRKMQQNISGALAGEKTAADALAAIGLSAKQLQDLSPDQQFKLIAEAISRIEDPAQRTDAALTVLGKSGADLLPMMLSGAKGIEALQQQARDLSLTMRGEDARAATLLGDTMDDLWKVLRNGVFVIGSALAPLLIDITKRITSVAVTVKTWIDANRPLVASIFKIAAVVAGAGAALIAVGLTITSLGAVFGGLATIITGVGSAIGILVPLIASIMSPVGLVIAGVVTLATTLVTCTETGGQALDWLLGKFNELKDGVLRTFKGITDALVAGNFALAANVMWSGLKVAWQQGISGLTELWVGFKRTFMEISTGMWYGAQVVLVNAWSGLQTTWVEVVSFLSTTWTKFTSSIQIGWSTASDYISKAMLDLWKLWDDKFGSGGFNADLAKSFIDQQGQAKRSEIATSSQADIQATETDRKKRLEQISTEQNNALAGIGNADAEARAARESAYAKQLQASQAELAQATQAWNDSLKQASTEADAARAGLPGAPSKPKFLDSSITDQISAALSTIKGEAKGGFAYNSYGLQSLAAGSAADKTAKNTEEMVRQQKITNRKLDSSGSGGLDVE